MRAPVETPVAPRSGGVGGAAAPAAPLPLRHGLMLVIALAVMVLGAVSAHRYPIYRAIIVLPPALQGAVVT